MQEYTQAMEIQLLLKEEPGALEPHTFAPKDLLALLRNLENEICMCEISLKDENDKQNKYKVRFYFVFFCVCPFQY